MYIMSLFPLFPFIFKFGSILGLFLLNIFLFSQPPSSKTPIICMLDCLVLSHRSLMLCSFVSVFSSSLCFSFWIVSMAESLLIFFMLSNQLLTAIHCSFHFAYCTFQLQKLHLNYFSLQHVHVFRTFLNI